MKKKILILCTGNSARSQIAEALLRHFGGEKFAAYSAGTRPVGVHPLAIEAMREIGLDLSGHRSKAVSEFAGQKFDAVITVCDAAAEQCPVFPGAARRIHWSLPDPAAASGSREEKLRAFRGVRDQLKKLLSEFANREAGSGPGAAV